MYENQKRVDEDKYVNGKMGNMYLISYMISLKIKVEVNVEFELNQPLEFELFTTLNINNRIPERRLES